jgi:predicted PolB exonuclease-like 3'-5' exonuclease
VNVLAFDIETVPDVELGRRLHGVPGLDDESVAEMMFALRRARSGSEFLPLEQHRIVAISAALRRAGRFKVWSLGEQDASEAELISRFFEGIERFTPTLVSWNGGGFDLPVLHYRCMLHGIAAPRYWETGDDDSSFRWNNYLSRYHRRHTDLMDVLSGYQPRASVALDRLATACGFPGKLGMSGEAVWPAFLRGEVAAIRAYCETDVVNTYLLYLRFERMRGQLTDDEYAAACAQVRDTLGGESAEHWQRFLDAWSNADGLDLPRADHGQG